MTTVLVTGGTDGVGRHVVERMAAPGTHILVHGRDDRRGHEVLQAVVRAGGTGAFLQADFTSLEQVRALAATVLARHRHLDVLINNAGIAQVDAARTLSRDGVEVHFAVNYLAPALLTRLLHPALGGQTPSRIVNVTSAAQAAIDMDDPMLARRFDGYRAYGQSKLADIMLTFDLAEELSGSGVTVDCIHPADHMDTAPVRAAGIAPANSADEGAAAVVALATSTGPAGPGGRYLNRRRESRAHAQAYDSSARRRLRLITDDLLAGYLEPVGG